jgi:hypothetical protein
MKCVGAEDGQPCQRCKRANVEYVLYPRLIVLPYLIILILSGAFLKNTVEVASLAPGNARHTYYYFSSFYFNCTLNFF